MKTKIMLAMMTSLILALFSAKASAIGYATWLIPGGLLPPGYTYWYSLSYSYTVADDFDDVIGFSLASEAIAPDSPSLCPLVFHYFSGWQTTPNFAGGAYLERPGGPWVTWCTGFYYVAGLHVFYLYGGDSFADVTAVPWGFF